MGCRQEDERGVEGDSRKNGVAEEQTRRWQIERPNLRWVFNTQVGSQVGRDFMKWGFQRGSLGRAEDLPTEI